MTDESKPKPMGAARPAGKRQVAGVSTTSSAAYTEKKELDKHNDIENDKKNVFARFFGAIPEVVEEMRKVIWPTAKQMVVYTLIVFAFLIVLTALVWGVDTLGGMGVSWVLTR